MAASRAHLRRLVPLAVCLALAAGSAGCAGQDRAETAEQSSSPQPPAPEDRGLLPVLGRQEPLANEATGEPPRLKLVYYKPRVAVAALDAGLAAPPGGCWVAPEVVSAPDGAVVINLRLMWLPNRWVDQASCAYSPKAAHEAHMLIRGAPATAAVMTDAPVVDVNRVEIRPGGPGNPVPLMPEQRLPGG